MPIGYLIFTALMGTGVLLVLMGARASRSGPIRLTHVLTWLINESPFFAFLLLVALTALAIAQFGVRSAVFRIAAGLAFATTIGLCVIAVRAVRTSSAVQRALSDELGPGWPNRVAPTHVARFGRRSSFMRAFYAPVPIRHPGVERVRNIQYADDGRAHRLDLYRARSGLTTGPTLVHLHGGAFVFGRKSREGRALLYRLARQGWTCVSANYRLRRSAAFAGRLDDVKTAIAWTRDRGRQYGADPDRVFVSGSSAGADLAAFAVLEADGAAASTGVIGAICLYGYYGDVDAAVQGLDSAPANVGTDMPPFLIVHGDLDSLVRVEDVRGFVGRLRQASSNPVVYAELPRASHGFDYFDSVRFEAVIDGIEAFAAWVMATPRQRP